MKLHINKEILKIFGGSIAFTVLISLGGRQIQKNFMCKIEEDHAHKYTSLSGLERYVNSENTIYELMLQSKSQVKYINEEEKKLIDFLDENDLYIIDENIDLIKEKEDFTEYEYSKERVDKNGKKVKVTDWTRDISKCDGNARDCYYVFEAYKIEDNQLVKSDKVESLLDIKDEYPYIKSNYYEIIRGDIYNIELDNNRSK